MDDDAARKILRSIKPGDMIGTRADGIDTDEGRYIRCPKCGQMIDGADLGQIFHHDDPGHKPLPESELTPGAPR